ncbi:MAG: biosynthetic-type acetolactate synthase large subunit, partial [Actinomycetota bacterium]
GVETIFGLPGGAILPVYDPIRDSSIRHVLVRHEQGAGHMAEGYALATGKPGVAIVTSGPGATNIVTPIANAYMDSTPLVVITGQVASASIGTDAFQECDITGITMGITKHNFLITSAEEIPRVVAAAFHIATTGRPGPVLIDFPKDIAQSKMEWWYPESIDELDLPGYKPEIVLDLSSIEAAVALISEAERPVLYVGGGTLKSDATAQLVAFAERTKMPVVTTLMARGAFPDSHPQHLGMPGMHGTYTAVTAIQKSDLLISLGARFDDRVTGKISAFAAGAKIIHVDIDPAEFNKVKPATVSVRSDIATALEAFDAAKAISKNLDPWWEMLNGWREQYPLVYAPTDDPALLRPQEIIEAIAASAKPGTIVSSGVGQHQMWTSQFWKFDEPRTWINSGGAGTMGFGVPAAIGAKAARPDVDVWCIDGDGCFQMTAQELVTATSEGFPIKVAILNNAYLGMVRQWQEMFYEERFSEVFLDADLPDYVKWAESMGAVGLRARTIEEMHDAIRQANEIHDRSVVIDFRTPASEKVFPMVAAGASNDDIMVHPLQEVKN